VAQSFNFQDIANLRIVVDADTNPAEQGLRALSDKMTSLLDVSKIGGAFGAGFELARKGIDALIDSMGGLERAAIGLNARLQQADLGFTAITGSAGQAAQVIDSLSGLASRAPLDMPQALVGAQRLLAVGYSAQQVTPLIRDVVNISNAFGQGSAGIQRITYDLDQMRSSVVLNSREMRSLTMQGIPAWELLAEQTGRSVQDLRKATEQGKISADQMVQALVNFAESGRIGDFMKVQADTFTGAMQIIRQNSQRAIADALQPLFGEFNAGVIAVRKFTQSDDFQIWVGIIKAATQGAITEFNSFIQALAPIGDAIKKAFDLSSQGNFAGAGAALVKPFVDGLQLIRATINSFTGGMFDAGVQLVTTFARGIYDASETVIGTAVNAVANVIASFLIGHSPPAQGPLSQITEGGRNVMAAYIEGFLAGLPGLQTLAQQVSDALTGVNQSMTLEQGRQGLQAAGSNLDALKTLAVGVKQELDSLNQTMANLDAQAASYQLQINSIKMATQPGINDLQRQLDSYKLPTDYQGDIARQRLQIQNQELNQQKMNMGDDPGGYQTQIDALTKQADAFTHGTRDLDNKIADMRNAAALIGRGATDAVDAQIENLRINLQTIRDNGTQTLDNQINAIRGQLNDINAQRDEIESQITKAKNELNQLNQGPDPTQQMRNNVVALHSQQYGLIGDAAANMDRQIQGQSDAIRKTTLGRAEQKSALEVQIQQLEQQKQIITDTDDAHKRGLNEQLASLELQKTQLTEQNRIAAQGIQSQINGLEAQRRAIELNVTHQKQASEDAIRGLEDQRRQQTQTDQDAKAGIDEQIKGLREKKQHQFDFINDQIKQNSLDIQALDLAAARKKLENDILTLPIRQELELQKNAQADAIAPLQQQLDLVNLQKSSLQEVIKQYDQIARQISTATSAQNANKTPAELGFNVDINPDSLDESIRAKQVELQNKGKAFGQHISEGAASWIRENAGALLGTAIGAVVGTAVGGPAGGVLGAILGRNIGDEIQRTMDQFGSLGHAVKTFVEVVTGQWGPSVGTMIAQMGGMDGAAAAVALTIREVVIPHIQNLGRVLSTEVIPAVGKFFEYLREHPALSQAMATALGVITAGFTALSIVNTVAGYIRAAAAAFTVLNTVLLANPIGLIVVAIAALAAGFVLLYNNNKQFHDFVQQQLLPRLREFGTWVTGTAVPAVQEFAQHVGTTLLPALQSMGTWITETALPALQSFGGFITGTIVPALGALAGWIGDNIVPKFGEFAGFLTGTVIPALGQLASWIGDNILPVLGRFGEWFTGVAVAAFDAFSQMLETRVFPVLQQFWGWINDTIMPLLQSFVSFFKDVGLPILNAAFTVMKNYLQTLVDFWKEHWNQIRDIAKDVFDAIKITTGLAFTALKDAFQIGWAALSGVVEAFVILVKGLIDGFFKSLKGIIDLWHGILTGDFDLAWKGIKEIINGEWTSIQAIIEAALKLMQTTLDTAWTAIKDAVKLAWQGVGGVKALIGDTWDAIKNVFITGKDAMQDAIMGPFNWVKDNIGTVFKGIGNSALDQLRDFLAGFQGFVNAVQGALNWVGDKVGLGSLAGDPWKAPEIKGLYTGAEEWQGGLAVVADKGREIVIVNGVPRLIEEAQLINLPQGAEVIKSEDTERILRQSSTLQNPLSSLATGGMWDNIKNTAGDAIDKVEHLGGAALHSVRDFVGKGADWLVDHAFEAMGVKAPVGGGAFGADFGGHVLSTVTKMVKDGIGDLIKGLGSVLPQEQFGTGSAAAELVAAVKAVTDDIHVQLAMLFAVAGEHRTLSAPGIYEDQLGGPARGPWQIEDYLYPGAGISEAGARDVMTAARYMVGRFTAAAAGKPWDSDEKTAAAMTAAQAERGAAYLRGNLLGYDDRSVIDSAYNLAKSALSPHGGAAGAVGGQDFTGQFIPPTEGYGVGTGFHEAIFYGTHQGVDLMIGSGNPVWAIGPGVVSQAVGRYTAGTGYAGNSDGGGFGNYVVVNLGNGIEAITAHMEDVIAQVGQQVQQHQLLGYSDQTGNSTGPHVHFQINENGTPVDPRQFVALARGGYVTRPTLAMVGEGGQPEFVTPESMMRDLIRQETTNNNTYDQPVHVTIEQHIHPTPGMNERQVAAISRRETEDVLRKYVPIGTRGGLNGR
jgi:tape measure domain-containing protein